MFLEHLRITTEASWLLILSGNLKPSENTYLIVSLTIMGSNNVILWFVTLVGLSML